MVAQGHRCREQEDQREERPGLWEDRSIVPQPVNNNFKNLARKSDYFS